jgi:hypothetical protein
MNSYYRDKSSKKTPKNINANYTDSLCYLQQSNTQAAGLMRPPRELILLAVILLSHALNHLIPYH